MADKYPSTMLVDLKGKTDPQAQSDEINKALHDLLDKINKIAASIPSITGFAPLPQLGAGVGQWQGIQQTITNTVLNLPADGTWAYFGWYNPTTGIGNLQNPYNSSFIGIAKGGTTIVPAAVGLYSAALIWRIA